MLRCCLVMLLVGLLQLSVLQPAKASSRSLQGPGPRTVKRQVTATGGLKLYSDDNPCSKNAILSIPRCAVVDYLAIAGQKKCADGSCRIYVSYKGEWGYIASGKPKGGQPCGSAGGVAYVATYPATACKPKKPPVVPKKPTLGGTCRTCWGHRTVTPQDWKCGIECVTQSEFEDRLDCMGISEQVGCSAGRKCCVTRLLSGSGGGTQVGG